VRLGGPPVSSRSWPFVEIHPADGEVPAQYQWVIDPRLPGRHNAPCQAERQSISSFIVERAMQEERNKYADYAELGDAYASYRKVVCKTAPELRNAHVGSEIDKLILKQFPQVTMTDLLEAMPPWEDARDGFIKRRARARGIFPAWPWQAADLPDNVRLSIAGEYAQAHEQQHGEAIVRVVLPGIK